MYEAMNDSGAKVEGANGSSAHVGESFQGNESSPIDENSSSVLSSSSVVHRSPPSVQIKQTKPTTVDTDKDTQQLVEEDKSEC